MNSTHKQTNPPVSKVCFANRVKSIPNPRALTHTENSYICAVLLLLSQARLLYLPKKTKKKTKKAPYGHPLGSNNKDPFLLIFSGLGGSLQY